MKRDQFKSCNNCDHTLCRDLRNSPCRRCLSHRGLRGWMPMRWVTRIRRWLRRLLA